MSNQKNLKRYKSNVNIDIAIIYWYLVIFKLSKLFCQCFLGDNR